ncbi:MAG: hypothetical protein HYX72_08555 [Acidobacteria bacterium]|nr:hypothetical protein [Acidobacteriota bacterium]
MRKLFFYLLFVVVSTMVGGATTLVQMDLDDLTSQAQTIVYGRIVSSRTEWDKNHSAIYTFYTVQPIEYLKGQLGSTFELQEMGGTLDGLTMRVPSAPEFKPGQEEVLFVWTDQLGRNLVIGMEQGAVGVETDQQTGQKSLNRTIRIGSSRELAKSNEPAPVTSKLLPQFFDQVRRSAAKAAQRSGNSGERSTR